MTTATALHIHAAEVDTMIAATYETFGKALDAQGRALEQLHYSAGDRKKSKTRWIENDVAKLMVMAEARAAASVSSWNAGVYRQTIASYEDAKFVADAARECYVEAEKQYEGWTRFFWVANTGGHIHESMRCRTCYPTTRFVWNPKLSGLTEAEAVAALGPKLCSVCYPSAPVEWKS